MRPPIIPAILASAGFLLTFTIRSWHAGIWHRGEATDYAIVSTPQQPDSARTRSGARSPFAPGPRLASVLPQESARPRDALLPSAEPAVTPVDTSGYLSERAREGTHSSRMH